MSVWFVWSMTILNALAAGFLFAEKQYAFAIMYICYAIAGASMTWVMK